MPRQRREFGDSKIYHIMLRGNEKKYIFYDEEDKERFINILLEKKLVESFRIYAFCLMDNHLHLLINDDYNELATIMKRITVSYVQYFNRKYNRVGHLFHDRFKSEIIDSDRYLFAAIRYIHNNPVKAGMVDNIDYKWSSYNYYINSSSNSGMQIDTDMIMGMFSEDKNKALKYFVEYSKQEAEDSFIDYEEQSVEDKEINSIDKALLYANEFLKKYHININALKMRENKKVREELVLQLKNKSSLSVRQIAETLYLDRNIVQRTK